MFSRGGVIVLVAAFVGGAVGCSSSNRDAESEIVEYEASARPAPTGPYAVGREELILVDPSRSIRYEYDEARGINQKIEVTMIKRGSYPRGAI